MADTQVKDMTEISGPTGDERMYIQDDPTGSPVDRYIDLDGLRTWARVDDVYDAGTGSEALDEANGNYVKLTNNGALTITAPALGSNTATSIVILITNGASAGAITWTNFDANTPHGDSLTTTNGDDFLVYVDAVHNGTALFATATVRAMQ